MKVHYPIKEIIDIKEVKAVIKPFGGRCAKIVEDTLEYQIKEENETEAYAAIKEKGFVN
nr:hypothetical protein [uncultured Bacillus sp.]